MAMERGQDKFSATDEIVGKGGHDKFSVIDKIPSERGWDINSVIDEMFSATDEIGREQAKERLSGAGENVRVVGLENDNGSENVTTGEEFVSSISLFKATSELKI